MGNSLGWAVDLQDLNSAGRQDVIATSPFETFGDHRDGAVDLLLSSATGRPAADSSRITGSQFSDARGSLLMLGSALVAGGRPGAVPPTD